MTTTLKEYLADAKLWDAVAEVKEFPFLVDGSSRSVMETSLKYLYGQRIMFSAASDLTIQEIAQQLVMLHGDKWEAMTSAKTDMSLAGDYKIIKKGSSEKNRENSIDSVDRSQTIAYNETELSDESGSTRKSSDTVAETGNDSQETDRISYTSYWNNLQNADRLDIMKSILLDAARLLTINVY